MLYLTRRERFSAAHKLWRKDWSKQKNLDVFGKCANPNWHGHNYELYVTVKGNINPETGFVIDLKDLGRITKEKIISHLDHKNINLDCVFMQNKLATTENLVVSVWNELQPQIEAMNCKLHAIKIAETENNTVEYFGE